MTEQVRKETKKRKVLWKLNYPFHKIDKILISSRAREIEDAGLEFYFSISFQLVSVNQKQLQLDYT